MMRWFHYTVWGILLFGLAEPVHGCTMPMGSLVRNMKVPYFLATATSDSARVLRSYRTTIFSGDIRNLQYRTDTVMASARIFEAGPVAGDSLESAILERAFAKQGNRRVAVVWWMFDPACDYSPHAQTWNRPGRTIVLTTKLQPETQWAAGIPTFDVYTARDDGYIPSVYFQTNNTAPEIAEATSEAYLQVYAALPDSVAYAQRSQNVIKKFNQWLAQRPDLMKLYPFNYRLRWTQEFSPAIKFHMEPVRKKPD